MNRKSFIYRLAKENPIMLYNDRIYELTNGNSSEDFFLSISGIKKVFRKGEPIVNRESFQYQSTLDDLIIKEENIIKNDKTEIGKAFNKVNLVKPENFAFIRRFLQKYDFDDEHIMKDQDLSYNLKTFAQEKSMLHKNLNSTSVFSNTVNQKSIFIFNSHCYTLIDKGKIKEEYIKLNYRKYSLKYLMPLEELERKYQDNMSQFIHQIINNLLWDYKKHLIEQNQKISELQKKLKKCKKSIKFNTRNPKLYLALGSCQTYFGDFEDAKKTYKEAIRMGCANSSIYYALNSFIKKKPLIKQIEKIINNENNRDYRAYYFLSLEVQKEGVSTKKDQKYYLNMMIKQMIKNDEFKQMVGDYKKATNKIKIIKGDKILSNTVIVKESDNSFKEEREIKNKLKQIICNDAILPTEVYNFKEGGKHYYIMVMESGETLTDLIKEDNVPKNIYDNIIKVMAKIHVHMSCDEYSKYDFNKKINEKNLESQIKSALNPIINLLQHSNHYGINQDAWTDNWMVSKNDGSLVILDTEERGTIPVAIDLANLLNYVPSPSDFNERLNLVDDYIKHYNNYCIYSGKNDYMIEDINKFKREYCAAVVFKGVTNSSNIGSVLYSRYHDQVIDTADEMIDYMQKQKMISKEESLNLKNINHLKVIHLDN